MEALEVYREQINGLIKLGRDAGFHTTEYHPFIGDTKVIDKGIYYVELSWKAKCMARIIFSESQIKYQECDGRSIDDLSSVILNQINAIKNVINEYV